MNIKNNVKAPAFTLPDQNGNKQKLSDYKGKWIVLYTYPRDMTPGCTLEAISFTKSKKTFEKQNTVILGISADSPEKHCHFIEKKELEITLLSDIDHEIIEKYGAWQLKKFMGKEFMGIVRSTWIINPDGKIVYAWEKVRVKEHVETVLEKLNELQTE